MKLGHKLREIRIQKKLTQKDVVGEYMTRNMLSKIENGSATPSVKTLEYLSEALEVPASYFLSDEGQSDQIDRSQLDEIDLLCDGMLSGEIGDVHRAFAVCIKARLELARGRAVEAVKMIEGCGYAGFEEGRILVLKTLEDCCKSLSDYKGAYECAMRRLELEGRNNS